MTIYDGKSQLLIKNPINRYLINSAMLPGMKKNDDGSLTLYMQKDSPGADKEANWLPAPNDTIYLILRLYWPKTEAAGRRHLEAAGDRRGAVASMLAAVVGLSRCGEPLRWARDYRGSARRSPSIEFFEAHH